MGVNEHNEYIKRIQPGFTMSLMLDYFVPGLPSPEKGGIYFLLGPGDTYRR